jgi:hypothetical protein
MGRGVIIVFVFLALALYRALPLVAQAPRPVVSIFGGSDHKKLLGCLTCEPSDANSIFNSGGDFGHCGGLAFDNLYCHTLLSAFGTAGLVADATSACGPGSSNPPVLVDPDGGYYGRFSVGTLLGHADSVCSTLSRFYSDALCKVVKRVCEVDAWS